MRQPAQRVEATLGRTGRLAARACSTGAGGSGAPSHRPARSLLLISLCLAVAALLALCASPAFAAQTHPYTGVSFGPDGVGGSASFEGVGSVAVEPVSGDVYVYDSPAGKIYKFDSAGAPVNFSATGTNAISNVGGGNGPEFQVAVAPAGAAGGTGGDIYVAHGNNGQAVDVYSAAGTKIGELEQGGATCGVATDPSGAHVYTSSFGGSLSQYTPTANPPTDADKTATGEPGTGLICNIAADGLGNVYEAGYFFSSSGLYRLAGVGDATPTLVDPRARSMAVDGSSNDLYGDRENEVAQYDSTGSLIGRFGEGEVFGSYGIAANSNASKIYVGSTNFSTGQVKVKVFGPQTAVPDATAETADAITKTTAVLHGTVGAAGGPETTCVFQYVTESEYFGSGFEGASEKPCSPAGPFTGSSTTAVSATATGLSQQTAYRFRLLTTNSNGSNGGASVGFVTPGAVNVLTGAISNLSYSSATLNGTVNPEGIELEECTFEYRPFVFGASFDSVPCAESPASIGTGNTPVPVHLDLAGLTTGTTYEFRLVGKNELGTSSGAYQRFSTKGPTATKESISGVTETAATFHATLNPNGVATSYVFEYVTQAAFEQSGFAGATSVPVGGKGIGAGNGGVEVSAQAEGLAPHTAYRFRVVATNADGVASGPGATFTTRAPTTTFSGCPNDAFRSGFGAALPDCRAYERATPAYKAGLDVAGFPDLLGGASDGSGVSFAMPSGSGIPAGGGGREDITTMLSRRVGDSWSTQNLLPPESLGEKGEYLGSTENMRYALVEAGDEQKAGLYLIDTADESVTQVVPYQTELGVYSQAFHYDAISADGSRAFFESRAKLIPTAVAGVPNLYVWSRASGTVSLAGVLPAGEGGGSPPEGSFAAGYIEEPQSGGGTVGRYIEPAHAVAADGDWIYFTARSSGQLYLRRGLDGDVPTTVAVSKPNEGVEDSYVEEELFGERFPAAFQEASADGARAFFTSSEKLTADASTGAYDEGRDLYRYDRASDGLVDVTGGLEGPENPNGARVLGLLGVSSDGSAGYFAAKGKLRPEATTGANNIYRFEEEGDGSFHLTYVGEGGSSNWSLHSYSYGIIGDYEGKTARVSADAGSLVYTSGGQIRIYRAAEDEVNCVSCDPTGSPSIGEAELTASFLNGNVFIIPLALPASRLPRSLSADGSRVFFQTPNSLLGADTNGSPTCRYLITRPVRGLQLPECMDVYEWEAVGAPGGSCTKVEFNGGCLYLLSTGKSEDPSYLVDASSDGGSAFIATTSQLVPADNDQLFDLYDVRTDGGLASQQAVTVAPCSGEACRGSIGTAPASQTAGTASFHGPGNAKPAAKKRCGKKSQKCAKKKKKSGHKHKRNKNKHGHARSSKGDRK